MLKLSRIFQPRNPLFWIMVILNALSSMFAWLMRVDGVAVGVVLGLGALALANVGLGLLIALRLMRDDGSDS